MSRLKKLLLLLSLVAMLSSGASTYRLRRLKVVNESGMDIAVLLVGAQEKESYYLRVADGDPLVPTTEIFTIERDTYSATIYYLETYDPVYGYQCSAGTAVVNATHNTWLLIKKCGYQSVKTMKPEKDRLRRLRIPIGVIAE